MAGMSFFLITLLLALGVALVTGGSLRQVMETRLRATPVLFLALATQLGLDLLGPSRGRGTDLDHWLLVASYVLLLGFCAANLGLRGMSVVAIGIALNAAVITVNRGMPIRTTRGEVTTTVKHHRERPSDRLMPLADIIVVPPINQALSFGDLIMVVGLMDVLVHRSRATAGRRGRRSLTSRRMSLSTA
jgi:hypothetical protein